MSNDVVDAVITWVAGSDPIHQKKRRFYSDGSEPKNSTASKRFEEGEDLIFCLRSIFKYAPWIRNIYILTDAQVPPIRADLAEEKQVFIIDHKTVFRGFENYLPTFNSLAIEAFLWRIEGLANQFIYFNDDFGLCRPVSPELFFQSSKVVLCGKWREAEGSGGRLSDISRTPLLYSGMTVEDSSNVGMFLPPFRVQFLSNFLIYMATRSFQTLVAVSAKTRTFCL